MSSLEMDVGQALASQRGPHHGSGSDETTRERLSSLIREKGLRPGSCWALLAESSTDRFVILQGIGRMYLPYACNDEFKLVAFGSMSIGDMLGPMLGAMPGAEDLARVVHKIMCKKRKAVNDSAIFQKCVLHGLLICHLVANEARFYLPFRGWGVAMQSLEPEMEMLSPVLKPPSVLAAAGDSPSLLAQGPLDTAASSFASRATNSVAMDSNFFEEAVSGGGGGVGNHNFTHVLPNDFGNSFSLPRGAVLLLPLELHGTEPMYSPYSSFGTLLPVRNGGGGGYDMEAGVLASPNYFGNSLSLDRGYRMAVAMYSLHSSFGTLLPVRNSGGGGGYNLEAGGLANWVGGGAAAPVQQPPDGSQRLDDVMVQAFAAFLPACVTAYPLLKDAPDYIKFTIFGGLAFTTLGLFIGTLSNSVARRRLAIRLVSFSAIAVLTFCTASQFSSRIYVALTALVGVVLNLIIMLLRF